MMNDDHDNGDFNNDDHDNDDFDNGDDAGGPPANLKFYHLPAKKGVKTFAGEMFGGKNL